MTNFLKCSITEHLKEEWSHCGQERCISLVEKLRMELPQPKHILTSIDRLGWYPHMVDYDEIAYSF